MAGWYTVCELNTNTIIVHIQLNIYTSCRIQYYFISLYTGYPHSMFLFLYKHRYAIRDGNKIKIFKNFKERKAFKPEYGAESKYMYYQCFTTYNSSFVQSRLLPCILIKWLVLWFNCINCRYLWWESPWSEVIQWAGFL